jgi:hypothetical protein
MRRLAAVVVVSVIAALGLTAIPADAQTPKVTINGLVDNVVSWSRNMSVTDANYDRTDTEKYMRTRVRPDITAEVGTTKFVLGLEIDAAYGQVGASDTNVCTGTACPTAQTQRSGSTGGWDLNTDTIGQIEVKWAYTEFDIPWIQGARLRIGAQPFQTTYKNFLANGDFAGVNLSWAITPAIRMHLAYAQIEELSQESSSISTFNSNPEGTGGSIFRGIRAGGRQEDYAIVTSVELTPFKGLDIRPIYAYLRADGTTSGSSRQGRGGVPNAAPSFTTLGGGTVPLPGFFPQDIESRHTLAVDARLKIGPFYFDPTVAYQFGSRDVTVGNCTAGGAVVACTFPGASAVQGRRLNQDLDAWLFDFRGGFQAGPLLVEGAFIYTTGNTAGDNLMYTNTDVKFYQPINTDTGFYAGMANIFALGIDYFNILYSGVAGMNPGVAIGYDRYGLMRVGAKASYALTPSFTAYAGVTASWTAEDVDVNSVLVVNNGLINSGAFGGPTKKESYLGTELNAGFTWRMAPNLALDVVGGYLFAGDALGYAQQATLSTTAVTAPTGQTSRDVEDVKTAVARIRFTF